MTVDIPIEVTTRYVTTVNELSEAWRFVMDRLEVVGPDPAVSIRPIRIMSVSDALADRDEPSRQFEVTVEGMVQE